MLAVQPLLSVRCVFTLAAGMEQLFFVWCSTPYFIVTSPSAKSRFSRMHRIVKFACQILPRQRLQGRCSPPATSCRWRSYSQRLSFVASPCTKDAAVWALQHPYQLVMIERCTLRLHLALDIFLLANTYLKRSFPSSFSLGSIVSLSLISLGTEHGCCGSDRVGDRCGGKL